MNISSRDKNMVWHPFTQEKIAPEVLTISRGSGSYLYDENNKSYFDAISSWWVNIHGHAHPDIARSIYEQAIALEHVIFAGCTHEPAVSLCEGLMRILPKNLCRFFFSDNGSTSVEVALKMAYQYWRNVGCEGKTTFLSFEGGYHGDTFGAMSVGAHSGFHEPFQSLLFHVLSVPYPETWDDDEHVDMKESQAFAVLEQYVDLHCQDIAAMILEPLVQGASGMRMCRPSFIQRVVRLLQQHHILVIFDEVMTGFGRTGTYFALDQLDVSPDFLCISKGITGGFLPLALTVTHQEIYDAFLGDDMQRAFLHGHSYTANPLACRAAVASLSLLTRPSCQEARDKIYEMHCQGMALLKSSCSNVEKVRVTGTIAACHITNSVDEICHLKNQALDQGILLRPLGNTLYILPPYCTTTEELHWVYHRIMSLLSALSS